MWLVEHAVEVESDMSVFHRVDSLDDIGMPRLMRLIGQLPAYRGALDIRLQADRSQAPTSGDTPDDVVRARFHDVLLREFPDDAAGGVQEISDAEFLREVSHG